MALGANVSGEAVHSTEAEALAWTHTAVARALVWSEISYETVQDWLHLSVGLDFLI